MVLNNDTTDHDDCDSSASSSVSSGPDVHFDGPLGNAVVTFTDKKSGKFLSSYNQQDFVLTQDDIVSSSTAYHCITQASQSTPPPLSALASASVSFETQYE